MSTTTWLELAMSEIDSAIDAVKTASSAITSDMKYPTIRDLRKALQTLKVLTLSTRKTASEEYKKSRKKTV